MKQSRNGYKLSKFPQKILADLFGYRHSLVGAPKPRTGRSRVQSNTPSAWLHASHDQ